MPWPLDAAPASYRTRCWLAATLSLALPPELLRAQAVPRCSYLSQLPATPALVAQTAASARLQLYGDADAPGSSDALVTDGIDDRRAERLLAIAEQFSPILRRNTFVVPRDVWWVVGNQPVLQVDQWIDDRLVHSDSVTLGPRTLPAGSGRESPAVHDPSANDQAL